MANLQIRLTKRSAEDYVLTCVRANGTVTRSVYRSATARFFPRHDLTHVAVETVLGFRQGFYGLVAQGWNLSDFGAPKMRGKLPLDMDPVENIVGLLDREMTEGRPWKAKEINGFVREFLAAHASRMPFKPLTEATLARIRTMQGELYRRWLATANGATLELEFEVPAAKSA